MISRGAAVLLAAPLVLSALLLLPSPILLAAGGGREPGAKGDAFVPPAPRDKCPVCGMFVARTPAWVAELVFADGTYLAFDGAKDLFRHLLGPGAGTPPRSVWVTDYYSLAQVDGRTAFFVTGSDVLGPMGRELIPFAREVEAREFQRDHQGDGVHRFGEVTPALLERLE